MHLIDLSRLQPWASPLIAFFALLVSIISVRLAISEARKKARESEARAAEAKKYVEALETVIKAGRYMQYLQGVDENIGNVAKEMQAIALRSKEITELAGKQIEESVGHLRNASKAAEEVAQHLGTISKTALRAQRDSARAHEDLLREIRPPKESGPTSTGS